MQPRSIPTKTYVLQHRLPVVRGGKLCIRWRVTKHLARLYGRDNVRVVEQEKRNG
jgi:hypothetical protein